MLLGGAGTQPRERRTDAASGLRGAQTDRLAQMVTQGCRWPPAMSQRYVLLPAQSARHGDRCLGSTPLFVDWLAVASKSASRPLRSSTATPHACSMRSQLVRRRAGGVVVVFERLTRCAFHDGNEDCGAGRRPDGESVGRCFGNSGERRENDGAR